MECEHFPYRDIKERINLLSTNSFAKNEQKVYGFTRFLLAIIIQQVYKDLILAHFPLWLAAMFAIKQYRLYIAQSVTFETTRF